jgi:hypothetical protein
LVALSEKRWAVSLDVRLVDKWDGGSAACSVFWRVHLKAIVLAVEKVGLSVARTVRYLAAKKVIEMVGNRVVWMENVTVSLMVEPLVILRAAE